MFVDASAAIAIITREPEAASLAKKLQGARAAYVSAMVRHEAVAGLKVKLRCTVEDAAGLVDDFFAAIGADSVTISDDIGRIAVDAYGKYGKGQHKAALNMGDCFAYACAKASGQPLLFKGNGFVHTDIEVV